MLQCLCGESLNDWKRIICNFSGPNSKTVCVVILCFFVSFERVDPDPSVDVYFKRLPHLALSI